VSDAERLLSIIRKVHEKPELLEEYRLELYLLYKNDGALFEQTMEEFDTLSPQVRRDAEDFVHNIAKAEDFLKKVNERMSSQVANQ